MIKLGLIGFPLAHSFSAAYFNEKFEKENIRGFHYNTYELEHIDQLKTLLKKNPEIAGLNVTIPYKEQVLPFLDSIEESAKKIGAVNVIKIENGKLIGYNSDYVGFKRALLNFIDNKSSLKALVLGTGGASKAIKAVLQDLSIPFKVVSRGDKADFSYQEVKEREEIIKEYKLIINCTPLGTYPDIERKPNLPYEAMCENTFLFDLVYNPETTAFMHEGAKHGAQVKNGYEMLKEQAEASWEIWTS